MARSTRMRKSRGSRRLLNLANRARTENLTLLVQMLWGLANKITAHSNWVTLVDLVRLLPAPPQDSTGMPFYQSIYQYGQFGSDDNCILPDWNAALCHVKAGTTSP